MKVLHYLLGVPPVYKGGMVKYVLDIIAEEKAQGENVLLLVPGKRNKKRSVQIYKTDKYKTSIPCEVYEIQNALSSLSEDPQIGDSLKVEILENFKKFLQIKQINIIHIHSFIGLHKEFLIAAKNLGIPIVYTTHDYYGICLKSNLLLKGNVCVDQSGKNCPCCYSEILKFNSITDILYKKIIGISFIKNILNKDAIARGLTVIGNYLNKKQEKNSSIIITDTCRQKVSQIRAYYYSMFQMIDVFYFNSLQTEQIFKENIAIKEYKLIDITHRDIKDNRQKKEFGRKLRLSYLGTIQEIKGFYLLKDALDELYINRKNFELNVFFSTRQKNDEYINYNLPYKYSDLEKVMENTDVVVVPSICRETFGFVVKEAISYGVPCIMTYNVGAKDWVKRFGEIALITEPSKQSMLQTLIMIYDNRALLNKMNENILKMNYDFSFDKHVKKLIESYREIKDVKPE